MGKKATGGKFYLCEDCFKELNTSQQLPEPPRCAKDHPETRDSRYVTIKYDHLPFGIQQKKDRKGMWGCLCPSEPSVPMLAWRGSSPYSSRGMDRI